MKNGLMLRFPAFASVLTVTVLFLIACHQQRYAIVTDCFPTAPLLPVIRFREPTTAGRITALLLNAHRGTPISTGYIHLLGSKVIAFSDSTGRATLEGVPVGQQVLESRAVGYDTKHDTLAMEQQAGWALVIQLRGIPIGSCAVAAPTRR